MHCYSIKFLSLLFYNCVEHFSLSARFVTLLVGENYNPKWLKGITMRKTLLADTQVQNLELLKIKIRAGKGHYFLSCPVLTKIHL